MRRNVTLVLAGAGLLAAALALAAAPTGPALRFAEGEPGFTVGMLEAEPGQPHTFGLSGLCLEAGRGATVTGVRFLAGAGPDVVGFGTARQRPGLEVPGMVGGDAARAGFTSTSVTTHCDADDRTALAVTVALPRGAAVSASGDGLVVTYRVDGAPRSLELPHVRVVLCEKAAGGDGCEWPSGAEG